MKLLNYVFLLGAAVGFTANAADVITIKNVSEECANQSLVYQLQDGFITWNLNDVCSGESNSYAFSPVAVKALNKFSVSATLEDNIQFHQDVFRWSNGLALSYDTNGLVTGESGIYMNIASDNGDTIQLSQDELSKLVQILADNQHNVNY